MELYKNFEHEIRQLQMGFSQPTVSGNQTTRYHQTLEQGRAALDELSVILERHVIRLQQMSNSQNVKHLVSDSPIRKHADQFCGHLQTKYFDIVETDDKELVAIRKSLNRRVHMILSRFD
eukprot:c5609_g1_i2.p1 GENE.c5609_g1_i2~~c5609_g1_i2.p1  ORF type:complete len:120 (+),score=35.30 c5609_g1_i2:334-693(+)